MKTEFHEDFASSHVDPMDAQETGFDWQSLYQSLGEGQVELEGRDYEAMSAGVRALFQWILKVHPSKPCSERTIARRLIGLAWTIDPSLIEGSPSLSQIARDLDCNKVVLSIHSAESHRKFGIRNRAQSHGWNFKATEGKAQSDTQQEPKQSGKGQAK